MKSSQGHIAAETVSVHHARVHSLVLAMPTRWAFLMTCARLNMKSDHPLGHLMMLIALDSVRNSDFTLPPLWWVGDRAIPPRTDVCRAMAIA